MSIFGTSQEVEKIDTAGECLAYAPDTLAEYRIAVVAARHLPTYWPLARLWLEAAIERDGRYSVADVERDLSADPPRLWLWIVWREDEQDLCGALLTGIDTYPRARWLWIVALGGRDFAKWRHLIATVIAAARAMGCTKVRAGGRLGFKRHAEAVGGRLVEHTLEWEC